MQKFFILAVLLAGSACVAWFYYSGPDAKQGRTEAALPAVVNGDAMPDSMPWRPAGPKPKQ